MELGKIALCYCFIIFTCFTPLFSQEYKGGVSVGAEYTTGNLNYKGDGMSVAPIIRFFAPISRASWLSFYGHGKFFIDIQSPTWYAEDNPYFGDLKNIELVLGVNLTPYLTVEMNEFRSMDIMARYFIQTQDSYSHYFKVEFNYTPFITGNIWVYDHVNKINKLRRGHVDDIGLKIQYDLGVAPWVNLS
ncbi:MAG: hypothetical protein ACRC0X_00025, partial [Brevinema sp.]